MAQLLSQLATVKDSQRDMPKSKRRIDTIPTDSAGSSNAQNQTQNQIIQPPPNGEENFPFNLPLPPKPEEIAKEAGIVKDAFDAKDIPPQQENHFPPDNEDDKEDFRPGF